VTPTREVLRAYGRALSRETHVLAKRPALTWQQLHNRLQWKGDAIEERLAPERERRTVAGARPWFSIRTPFPESEALVRTLKDHGAPVDACAFSPDGRLIVSGGGRTLLLWDAESGVELGFLKGYVKDVKGCGFSPDGRWIVSASGDTRALKLWDPQTGNPIGTVGDDTVATPYIPATIPPPVWVADWAFSPDGRRIVSARNDKTLSVWDAESRARIHTLVGHAGSAAACAFSPDGRRISTAGEDGTLRVWDAESGAELLRVEGRGPLGACAFSPDGDRIIASSDGVLRAWEAESGAEIGSLGGPSTGAWAISPDGRHIVTTNAETLKLWDVDSGAELGTLVGHTGHVSCCAFSPDGSRIVSASYDRTLKLWEAVESGAELGARKPGSGSIRACAFSPDGRRIMTAGEEGPLRLWDTKSGEEIPSATPFPESSACASSPDGSRIASAGRILDAESGAVVTTFSGHSEPVTACAFSPDGRRVVSGSHDHTLRIWNAETGVSIHTLGVERSERELAEALPELDPDASAEILGRASHTDVVRACAFSPDNLRVASGGGDGYLKVWYAESGAEIWSRFGHDGGVWSCTFSPDGRSIVSAGDSAPSVWEPVSGDHIRDLQGHSRAVPASAFSPDGRWIVTGGQDNEVRLWDAESGDPVAIVVLPCGIRSVAMHPSSPLAACGGEDGNMYRAELMGVEYGPLIVTAVDFGEGFVVRCPVCWVAWPLDESWLGRMIECPGEDCTVRLNVNSFVVGAATEAAA
jgi:WD40 repeat protein